MIAVLNEMLQVFHLAAWFAGLVVLIGGPILAIYSLWTCSEIARDFELFQNQQGDSSTYMKDPRESSGQSSPASAVARPTQQLSTGEILDSCLTHRAQLQYYHRILCERVGTQPGSGTPIEDLIAEAVYDGRHVQLCIFEIELATVTNVIEEINKHA